MGAGEDAGEDDDDDDEHGDEHGDEGDEALDAAMLSAGESLVGDNLHGDEPRLKTDDLGEWQPSVASSAPPHRLARWWWLLVSSIRSAGRCLTGLCGGWPSPLARFDLQSPISLETTSSIISVSSFSFASLWRRASLAAARKTPPG